MKTEGPSWIRTVLSVRSPIDSSANIVRDEFRVAMGRALPMHITCQMANSEEKITIFGKSLCEFGSEMAREWLLKSGKGFYDACKCGIDGL